ncbi:hypothetical protein BUALT_Bualt14G0128600 [Buddleja alternifolia]|uniref:RNase H type-1 domain-containing protein n=1 Tax=Buddleja alternifolia TaxID=168488 RepID=A0AAV6WK62_9LAMI|nr:hypothetical protein BUALT_Bualt14G0128600 [Buddleja alternifolia]
MRSRIGWAKPDKGVIKLNVDAATPSFGMDNRGRMSGIGGVFRDWNGLWIKGLLEMSTPVGALEGIRMALGVRNITQIARLIRITLPQPTTTRQNSTNGTVQNWHIQKFPREEELDWSHSMIAKKSLNPVFKAVSEEESAFSESPKEVSKVFDENPFSDSPENFLAPVNIVNTPSSETGAISDLTSPSFSSLSITSDKYSVVNASGTKHEHPKSDSFKEVESIEAEMVIKHLREARVHVLKSNDVGPSKKLLDALIDVIIEEFYGGLDEEKEWLDKLLSTKANLIFLSFMLGIFAVFVFWFSNSGAKEFVTELTPT